jgi:dTDP-glucose 4,6-dehydratase
MKLLVTGGAGFIGSNFIRHRLGAYPGDTIVNVDVLTHAGVKESLTGAEENYPGRYFFERADICDYDAIERIVKKYGTSVIVNFAAESHNSYAVLNPTAFYRTNLMGTQNLLEVARKNGLERFHHISTCEVYGDLALESDEVFREDSPYTPNTPYNSSKACADLAVRAYYKSFATPVTISNCSNNYGPYQFPEKLIPLFVTNLLQGKPLTLYKESMNKREWLHVDDHCRAVSAILDRGVTGETYNVGSGVEKSVEEISDCILGLLRKTENEKTYVPSRPAHDRRYLLDSSKIRRELGWEPEIEFDSGMKATVKWYEDNKAWWEPLLDRRPLDEASW